jgi:hypothetical protein
MTNDEFDLLDLKDADDVLLLIGMSEITRARSAIITL